MSKISVDLGKAEPAEIRRLVQAAEGELLARKQRERSYSVWTVTDNPEWLRRNGVRDVLLAVNLTESAAQTLRDRIEMIYGDAAAEVRGVSDREQARTAHDDPQRA